ESMATPMDWRRAELTFARPDEYLHQVVRLYRAGARTFLLRPHDPGLASWLSGHFSSSIVLHNDPPAGEVIDAVLIPPLDAERLSAELLTYLDWPVPLIAPVTARFIGNQSMFVVTIP